MKNNEECKGLRTLLQIIGDPEMIIKETELR